MTRKHSLFFLLITGFCAYAKPACSQVFGGIPPSVRWSQINVPAARIIFSGKSDYRAFQTASLIRALNDGTLSTMGNHFRPVNIIFHDETTVSNAYVQLAPFRSEFQLTPLQNAFELGSLPWHQTLAIHEYRHVQQFNNFRTGLSRAFYILFGEEGQAFANNLAVPNWFWEGDAVFQETLVSKQGRGRLPLFLNGYSSLWLAGKNYSWMKLRNGSLRDYTPDHYPLGYMMVAYGRQRYGADFWKKTAGDAAAFRGLFYPLQKAISRNAGLSFRQYRQSAMKWFRDQIPVSEAKSADAAYGAAHRHFVADETFPQWHSNDEVLYQKVTYRTPPVFVEKNRSTAKEWRLKRRAVSIDDQFSLRGNKIVYAAYEPDLRWGWKDYSVLRVIDLTTGKDHRLAGKTKYFSPDIDKEGKKIVAVAVEPSGFSHLDFVDAQNGQTVFRLPNTDSLFYSYPKFYGPDELVAAARDGAGRMSLLKIDKISGRSTALIPWTMSPVGFISVNGGSIYFTRTVNGRDRAYRWRAGSTEAFRDSSATGVYQLSAGSEGIAWSGISAVGKPLHIIHGNTDSAFLSYDIPFSDSDSLTAHQVSALQLPPFLLQQALERSGPTSGVQKYPALTHPFHFHSWRPDVNDPVFQFSLVGQNLLNTVQSEIYAGYNRNEQYKMVGADLIYGGLFPYLSLGSQWLIDRSGFLRNGQKIYWNEWQPTVGFSIPFTLSRGIWLRSVTAGMSLGYHKRFFRGPYKDSIISKGYASIDPYFQFVQQLQTAKSQIYPSFAQTILFQYRRSVSSLQGNQFLLGSSFFFPGLAPTHSLELRAALQQRDPLNQVRFSNGFPFSRGYSGENFFHMYRVAANYHFPLVYPDWGFGNIVFIQRIRANAFYDYTGVPASPINGPGVSRQYQSAGMELYFDSSWWNELPLTLGIRYSRLLDRDYEGRSPNQWELILPLNILSSSFSGHGAR